MGRWRGIDDDAGEARSGSGEWAWAWGLGLRFHTISVLEVGIQHHVGAVDTRQRRESVQTKTYMYIILKTSRKSDNEWTYDYES
jgi:hypothetical protein